MDLYAVPKHTMSFTLYNFNKLNGLNIRMQFHMKCLFLAKMFFVKLQFKRLIGVGYFPLIAKFK